MFRLALFKPVQLPTAAWAQIRRFSEFPYDKTHTAYAPNAPKPFDKILIANRGEIACRIISTCKRLGVKTVAVYSEPDASSKHVMLADEAICIGPAASNESYLNIDKIVDAVKSTGAQAVHPGFGFLSEKADFVERLDKEGIVFIGPGAHAMHALGDKIESKKLAKEAGVNIIPGFLGEVNTDEDVFRIAHEIGYPVMIKAAAGGGGKGMRVAWNDQEAADGFRLSKAEAKSFFLDDRILIEKFIDKPRHIEIQVMSDGDTTLYFNERECSIQRRNQKVIEEAPSTFIDDATRKSMGEQAVKLAQAVNYKSAGTVEMLVDSQRKFYFLEMNTRLQVEHPITEFITGHDLVEHMLRVAAGQKIIIKQEDIGIRGWAMESRIYAEDPKRNFLPSIGRLRTYREPESKDKTVRCDSGILEGSNITVFYDPMICKLVTFGNTRDESIVRMREALDTYLIRGVSHNVSFLRAVMDNKKFLSGDISTNFIPEEFPKGFFIKLTDAQKKELALAASVMKAKDYVRNTAVSQRLGSFSAQKEINLVVTLPADETGDEDENSNIPTIFKSKITCSDKYFDVVLENEGKKTRHTIETEWSTGDAIFKALVDGTERIIAQYVSNNALNDGLHWSIQFQGTQFNVKVETEAQHKYSQYMIPEKKVDTSNSLNSPMPGSVISINVKPGDKVVVGQEVAVVEAMKMQNILRAARDSIVKEVLVKPGSQVSVDEILVVYEPQAAVAAKSAKK